MLLICPVPINGDNDNANTPTVA